MSTESDSVKVREGCARQDRGLPGRRDRQSRARRRARAVLARPEPARPHLPLGISVESLIKLVFGDQIQRYLHARTCLIYASRVLGEGARLDAGKGGQQRTCSSTGAGMAGFMCSRAATASASALSSFCSFVSFDSGGGSAFTCCMKPCMRPLIGTDAIYSAFAMKNRLFLQLALTMVNPVLPDKRQL